jgi:CDP-diacylglycerol--serine O-phosphatidyltransferase
MKDKRLIRAALKERLYRRRFLVPNAVTLANMFCGFLSCIYAAQGSYEKCAIAIGFAILLDGLDGRVARKLNATSKFGVEFDSFSDLTSFGIAPAIVMYHWCLRPVADEFGVFVCFIYALCAASRLARFNISAENLKGFTGLPTPGAAAFVAACVNFAPIPQSSLGFAIFGSFVMASLAFLMVSHIEFFSIKLLRVNSLGLFGRVFVGAMIGLIWYNSAVGFVALSGAYVLSGPLGIVRKWFRGPGELSLDSTEGGESSNKESTYKGASAAEGEIPPHLN